MALRPTGGATLNAFIAGLTYANGPWIAGINFEDIWDQGSATLTNVSQRHQYATSMGGTYRLAPGLQLIAEYAYQYRHQGNFNFATNVAGTGVGATRDAQANTFMFGTVLSW
jgi:predicted porin